MDEERFIFIEEHGSDFLPLRWFGNLLMNIGTKLTILGTTWGTLTEVVDTKEDYDA